MQRAAACKPSRDFWSPGFRLVVFLLSATSIGSLLVEMSGWCSMRVFTLAVFLPALATLFALLLTDRTVGSRRLWGCAITGAIAGLTAAIAYDVFRLPFVFARDLGLQHLIPALQLFKVFPRFGAAILSQPLEQAQYSLSTQLVGWVYHFSNGLTFGVMYVALIGDARKRHWGWGVPFAVGLELAMLISPYPAFFHIPLTTAFVVVTLSAHLVFGAAMGVTTRWLCRKMDFSVPA